MKSNELECLEQAILLQGLVLLELKGLRIISELDWGLAGQILSFAIVKIMTVPLSKTLFGRIFAYYHKILKSNLQENATINQDFPARSLLFGKWYTWIW